MNYKGPWGLNINANRVLPKRRYGFGEGQPLKPMEYLEAAVRATDQGILAACGGFSRAVAMTTFIRFKLGNEAIPDGHLVDPLAMWEVAKEVDGNKAGDNVGVNSAQSILIAAKKLNILPDSVPLGTIGADAASINGALLRAPICFAFACHAGFLPAALGPAGQVAESLGPNALDFMMRGHLMACIGIMPSPDPVDKDPLLYYADTWSERIGFHGFSMSHLSEMQSCLLELPWEPYGWDPGQNRGWEKKVVSYDDIAKRAEAYA